MKKEVTHKKVRNVGGRPLKLTDELIENVCKYLRQGAYVETAAAAASIRKETFYDWLRLGKSKPGTIYERFTHAIEKALADAEISDLLCISVAAKKNWSAAAWRLERRNPKRWAQAKRNEEDSEEEVDDRNNFTLNYRLDKKEK